MIACALNYLAKLPLAKGWERREKDRNNTKTWHKGRDVALLLVKLVNSSYVSYKRECYGEILNQA